MVRSDALHPGVRVRTADGAELGRVESIRDGELELEKGFLFRRRYALPLDAVAEIRDGEAWLAASRDELRVTRVHDAVDDREGGPIDAPRVFDEPAPRAPRDDAPATAGERAGEAGTADEEVRVPVVEEELLTRTHLRQAETVRIRKRVVTEHRQITVPVLREELVVERVRATPARRRGGGAPFEERWVTIPLYEEEIEIVKRPRLREEVRVGKVVRRVARTAEADVRRTEVEVERDAPAGSGDATH